MLKRNPQVRADEHHHVDEVLHLTEAVGLPNDELDLVVGRFDPGVVELEREGLPDAGFMTPDLVDKLDELRDSAVRGLEVPALEFGRGFVGGKFDDGTQPFLGQVGPIKSRIRVGDELKRCGLPLGEVVWILAHGVQRPSDGLDERCFGLDARLHLLNLAGRRRRIVATGQVIEPPLQIAGDAPEFLPGLAADVVEGIPRPLDEVERVHASLGVGKVLRHALIDPLGTVAGNGLDGAALLGRVHLQELLEHVHAVPLVPRRRCWCHGWRRR